MCLEYNKFIYPRWSRVEVVLRLMGWQALFDTPADQRPGELWSSDISLSLSLYIYIYIHTDVYGCILYDEYISPKWSRVEVVQRPTGSQAPPLTSIGRLETQADMI